MSSNGRGKRGSNANKPTAPKGTSRSHSYQQATAASASKQRLSNGADKPQNLTGSTKSTSSPRSVKSPVPQKADGRSAQSSRQKMTSTKDSRSNTMTPTASDEEDEEDFHGSQEPVAEDLDDSSVLINHPGTEKHQKHPDNMQIDGDDEFPPPEDLQDSQGQNHQGQYSQGQQRSHESNPSSLNASSGPRVIPEPPPHRKTKPANTDDSAGSSNSKKLWSFLGFGNDKGDEEVYEPEITLKHSYQGGRDRTDDEEFDRLAADLRTMIRNDFIKTKEIKDLRYHIAQSSNSKHGQGLVVSETDYALLRDRYTRVEKDYRTVFQERENFRAQAENATKNWREKEAMIAKLQAERLGGVDRFAPKVDTDIEQLFDEVQTSVFKLVFTLAKCDSELSFEELHDKILTSPKACYHQSIETLDISHRPTRKKVWNAWLWMFFHERLLQEPLRAFGDDIADNILELYGNIFQNQADSIVPNPASETWKADTVANLMNSNLAATDATILDLTLQAFYNKLGELQIKVDGKKEADVKAKFTDLVKKAVKFARVICTQRAKFALFFPELEKYGTIKEEDDNFRTSTDKEFPDFDEMAGDMWYLIKPGLIKLGNGAGTRFDEEAILRKAVVQLHVKLDEEEID